MSNKPDAAVKALCSEHFPGIYALGETPDCPRKPAPDMLFKAMKAIGADNCIYVGDSEVDILTAKNAGFPCISVLWGFRDKKDMPDAAIFCEKVEELLRCIELSSIIRRGGAYYRMIATGNHDILGFAARSTTLPPKLHCNLGFSEGK